METVRKWKYVPMVFVIFVSVFLAGIRVEAATKVSDGNTYTHTDGNTYTYTLYDDGTAKITKCDVANADVAIPETVDGHPVISLGISGQTTRVVPNGVTEIDSLYINSPYIQSYAFSRTNLHIGTLTLGEDVTTFGISIFSGDTIDTLNFNAANAACPGGGTPLGAGGLSASPSTAIGHLNIGENVEKIPAHMFCNVALEQDELEIHAPSVGNYAFESHGIHIGTLVLTDDVQTLGYHVTSHCTIDTFHYNVTEATVANSLNSICGGGSGSATTTRIGRLVIGDNVKYIPTMAFEYVGLEQDELTINAARIGNYAFHGKDIHIGTLNIGKDVERFGYRVFQNTALGTVNYDAIEAVCSGGSNYPVFENATIDQMNFGEDVAAIPAYLLKKSTIGNTELAIPAGIASIGTQWAENMAADDLEEMYVYAIMKTASPNYIALDYPDLYIHRESGFYDYFTDTNNGTLHDGMAVHLLCEDYAGGAEYEDNNGIANGYRRRRCSECGHVFEGEYLLLLDCGEGVSETDGQDYYVPEAEVTADCAMEEGYGFAGWVDDGTGETVSAEQSFSFTIGAAARRLRAEGTALEPEEEDADGGDDGSNPESEPAPNTEVESEMVPDPKSGEMNGPPIPPEKREPEVLAEAPDDDGSDMEEEDEDEPRKRSSNVNEDEIGSPIPMKEGSEMPEDALADNEAVKNIVVDNRGTDNQSKNATDGSENDEKENKPDSHNIHSAGNKEKQKMPEKTKTTEKMSKPKESEVSENSEVTEAQEEPEENSAGCAPMILLIEILCIGIWYFFRWIREYRSMMIDKKDDSEAQIYPVMDTETRKLLQDIEGRDEKGAVNAQCSMHIFSIDGESPVEVRGYSCTDGEAAFHIVPSGTSDIVITFAGNADREFRQMADACREFDERKDEGENVLINLTLVHAGDCGRHISAMCVSWCYDISSSEEASSGIRFHAEADQIFVVCISPENADFITEELEDERYA